MRHHRLLASCSWSLLILVASCSAADATGGSGVGGSANGGGSSNGGPDAGAGRSTGGNTGTGPTTGATGVTNGTTGGFIIPTDAAISMDTGPATLPGDPTTCDQAAANKTYVGCDYWPTIVANNVWSIFDFTVVVANGQAVDASVTVTGPSATNQSVTVPAGSLAKIFLPWVPTLKGKDTDVCGTSTPLTASVMQAKGAFHLVSSVPVTVYQFSPLEYQGKGGPPGKSWAACPGNQTCVTTDGSGMAGCFSFSNDASLLLPSTAMTGNYRVTGIHGWTEVSSLGDVVPVMGGYFAITATQDDTSVDVQVASAGRIVAGGTIPAVLANGVVTLKLQQGDVAELTTPIGSQYDLSGSQVAADKPVQVITGIPCINLPQGQAACDHVEESVLPAETLGKHYFVTVPTSPNGDSVGHIVRVYGNVDATTLTYAPEKPAMCPASIDAGQVVDCGTVSFDFEVKGDHEFAVGSFMLASDVVDPNTASGKRKGDPSQSVAVAVEQYRTQYVFLAPDDYDVSYVDIVGADGVAVTLDGALLTDPFTPIGATGFGVAAVTLGPGQAGAHVMTSTKPVGIQVMGYGSYTSYQYPGGLNLTLIAPPPPPITVH